MKTLTRLAAIVGLCAPAFSADLVVKTTRHSEDPRIKDVAVTTWIGKDRMRIEEGDRKVFIVRADLKKVFVLVPNEKKFGTLELPLDLEAHIPPEHPKEYSEAMATLHFTVTPTTESKKIQEWTAKKYVLTLSGDLGDRKLTITQDVWATKDVAVESAAWHAMNGAAVSFMMSGPDLSSELAKIEGLPVLVETVRTDRDKTRKSTETVSSVESKDAPEGAYDVPKDYTETKPFILGGGSPRGGGERVAPVPAPVPPPGPKKDGDKPEPPPK